MGKAMPLWIAGRQTAKSRHQVESHEGPLIGLGYDSPLPQMIVSHIILPRSVEEYRQDRMKSTERQREGWYISSFCGKQAQLFLFIRRNCDCTHETKCDTNDQISWPRLEQCPNIPMLCNPTSPLSYLPYTSYHCWCLSLLFFSIAHSWYDTQ